MKFHFTAWHLIKKDQQIDFICNNSRSVIEHMEPKNNAIMAQWTIYHDSLMSQNVGVYSCKLCNEFRCIQHKTVLEITGLFKNILTRDNFIIVQLQN
jgi:N-dimethylarginine dimethylaminohydrolase